VFFQLLSVVGAVLILVAYGLINTGRVRPTDLSYIAMNFVGSSLLAWVAIVDRRAGFILLEIIWALMSLVPLVRRRGGGIDVPAS
jgi:hypothetical protein